MSKKPFSIPQRLAIKTRQYFYKNRTNAPLLSGDSFASLCDLVLKDKIQIELLDLQEIARKRVFCRSDLVPFLLNKMKNKVKTSLIIAGNSDFDFEVSPDALLTCFDQAFLQNSMISDNKRIFTLPIGVENIRYGMNGLPKYLNPTSDWNARIPKILVGPFSPTHPDRQQLIEVARNSEFCELLESVNITPAHYSELVNRYRYVACPRGNGIDTHRFWETLYRGAIPVVKRSAWSSSLNILEIPFLEVETWNELEFTRVVRKESLGFLPSLIPSLWLGSWKEKVSVSAR